MIQGIDADLDKRLDNIEGMKYIILVGMLVFARTFKFGRQSIPSRCCASLLHSVTTRMSQDEDGKKYYNYIIMSSNRTYNGYTVDLKRRIRQHNMEIKGGARATRSAPQPWQYLAVFVAKDWTTIQLAMQFEWAVRFPTRKKPRPRIYSRPLGRLRSLSEVFVRSANDTKVDVFVHEDYVEVARSLTLPTTVTIHAGFLELGLT